MSIEHKRKPNRPRRTSTGRLPRRIPARGPVLRQSQRVPERHARFHPRSAGHRQAILVVLDETKIGQLRPRLNGDADRVLFADMAHVGANPARIIQAVAEISWTSTRGPTIVFGESVSRSGPGRSAAELAECQRHEDCSTLFFSDPEFSLLCPYDTGALGPAVIDKARRSHPFVARRARCGRAPATRERRRCRPVRRSPAGPPGTPAVFIFQVGGLRETRSWVAARADASAYQQNGVRRSCFWGQRDPPRNSLTTAARRAVSVWRQGATRRLTSCATWPDQRPARRSTRPAEGAVGGRRFVDCESGLRASFRCARSRRGRRSPAHAPRRRRSALAAPIGRGDRPGSLRDCRLARPGRTLAPHRGATWSLSPCSRRCPALPWPDPGPADPRIGRAASRARRPTTMWLFGGVPRSYRPRESTIAQAARAIPAAGSARLNADRRGEVHVQANRRPPSRTCAPERARRPDSQSTNSAADGASAGRRRPTSGSLILATVAQLADDGGALAPHA